MNWQRGINLGKRSKFKVAVPTVVFQLQKKSPYQPGLFYSSIQRVLIMRYLHISHRNMGHIIHNHYYQTHLFQEHYIR